MRTNAVVAASNAMMMNQPMSNVTNMQTYQACPKCKGKGWCHDSIPSDIFKRIDIDAISVWTVITSISSNIANIFG